VVLRWHPVARLQGKLADELQDLLRDKLVAGPVDARYLVAGVVGRDRLRAIVRHGGTVHDSCLPSSPGTRAHDLPWAHTELTHIYLAMQDKYYLFCHRNRYKTDSNC
jgi:hypothetical protein